MWSKIVSQAASGVAGWLQKSRDAKNQRKWDEYNNAMTNLQGAQAQNSISANMAENHRQTRANEILIQKSALMTAARVKADAAASGVSGRSVDDTLYDVQRNSGLKLFGEESRYDRSQEVLMHQRASVDLQALLSQKTLTPQPSILPSLLGTGLQILNTATDPSSNQNTSNGTLLNGGTQNTGGNFFQQLML